MSTVHELAEMAVVDHDQKQGSSVDVVNEQDASSYNLENYEIPPQETKKLLRKLDWHIAPVVMILYLIAFLDRANIGNASVGGMTKELNFPSNGLSLCTSIFYVTYVIFETPATTLLRTFRPSRMIPAVVVVWGAVVLGNGFAKSYGGVIACRLVLGICEAALSPCLFLYMTTFYRREELALRMCYLFIASALSGVVGGLIATGLLKMSGLHGMLGWRWLYIVEGAITIGIGFAVAFFIPDRYEDARYLNSHEKFLMRVRDAQAKAYSHDEGFSWVETKKAAVDPVIYFSGFVQLCMDVCLYGFATFLVVIVHQFGYNTIASQGITAPVYFVAAMVYLAGALASDKYSIRYWIMLPLGIPTALGYILLLVKEAGTATHLAGCFLAGAGIYLNVGLHITWLGQNVAGFRKRSTSVGLQQTFGNIGGVIAGQIYRSADSPSYTLGHGVSLGFWVLAMLGITVEWWVWRKRNQRREQMSDADKTAIDEKGVTGDHHYSFRYVL